MHRRITKTLGLGTLLVIILIGLAPVQFVAAASSSYEVRLSTTTPIVNSGDWAVIKVDYSCSAIFNVDCTDVVISSVIPPELARALGDVQALDTSGLTTPAYDPATSTATWTFNGPINPGDAGTFTLLVRFAKGSTPNGAIAILRAEMSGSGTPPVLSKPLPITAVAQPSARATKRFVSGGVLDLPTVYQVQVCVPSASGAVDITSVVMTDTLPAGATFVSASDGGVYNAGKVTWPAASILVSAGQSCLTHMVTVRFPTSTFTIGDEIRNDLAADVTFLGGATMSLSGLDVRLIQPPTPNPGFGKSGPANAEVGDIVTYSFSSSNSGTSPLDTHIFTDTIPVELDVTRIIAAAHNLTNTLRLQIEYQTSATPWTSVPGSPFTGASCVNIDPNTGGGCTSFNPGGRITALRYTYLDPLPYGFAVSSNGFMAKVVSAPVNQIIVNTADSEFSFNGHKILRQSTARTRVVVYTPGARPSVVKAVDPGIVYAGDTVTYTLTLNNNSFRSLTTPLVNPQIVDLLMSELIYVDGSQQTTAKPVGAPDPTFDIVPNFSGGKPLLRWRWTGASAYSLPVGATITIQFQARIAPYTASGSLSNTGYLSGWDNQPSDILMDSCSSSSADLLDFDNDGNTQEQICSSTISSVTLGAAANSGSLKEVLGQLDTAWTHDPDHGYTVPGGSADYQLTITNTGTIPISELTLLDILPWVGDVGVKQSGTPRGTEWRPFLSEPITVASGASVSYSTQNNPCRLPDLGIDPADESPGCAAPVWSSAPPADITTVQSFKITFGNLVLQPGESVVTTVHLRAPYSESVTAGQIAWNSFGYRARAVGAAEFLLAPEPPRVGIEREQAKPPAYGNYVWLDQNKDGLQTTGEPGVNGARIEFFRDNDGIPGQSAGDTLVDTTISGPDDAGKPGFYLFSSYPLTDSRHLTIMPHGDYYARITPPLGYVITTPNVGGDDAFDSDIDPAGYTPVTNLIEGEIDLTWDAGLTASTSVGNYVWIDRNANGLQDESADDGVNGVTVKLYTSGDTLVGTTTTANDPFGLPGYYLFDNLTPGDYYVEFTKPTGFTGFTTQGSGGTNPQDNDADPITGRTATFTLTTNQYDPTRDAGLTLTPGILTLGNLVWRDLNNNGRYDPTDGEYGIDGVRLSLSTSAGAHVGSSTTSTRLGQPGWYQFSNLAAGNYIVTIDASNFLSGGALFGLRTSTGNEPTPDPDTDIDNDDNGDLSGGKIVSQAITLSSGGEPSALIDGDGSNGNQTLDFGLIGGASLGNFVWFDTNGDGIQDSGEPVVPGVTVDLLDSGGAVLKTTTTDSTGRYGFSELSAGDYKVRFSDLPTGYSFTSPNSGSDTQLDSDADPATGETALITLNDGDVDLRWDAGLVATLASIGDRAWDDTDRDGVQDATETTGINGVTVKLYRADGTLVGTTTTANVLGTDGIYSFTDLPPGDYYVAFSNIPAGYTVSPQNIGSDDAKDSDADRTTRLTAITTLAPGENDPSWDIGLFTYASIGDYVWNDDNRDGVQDATEVGVPGVAVRLYRPGNSTPVASTTTDGSGKYAFTNLIPDLDYYLEFSMPAGYRTSLRDAGGDDSRDSDPDLSTYQTIPTLLTPGENDTSWDFGIYKTASIGDTAWLDRNANGIQDDGNIGIPGVQVILHNASGTEIDSTVTNTSGNYSFAGLVPGDYWLSFILPATYNLSPQDANGNTNDAVDSDVAPVTLRTIQTTLGPGENDPSWDIGLFQESKLGDRVWHDRNANGVQDPGEPGISGVAVDLLDGTGNPVDSDLATPGVQPTTTTTDASGNYLFSGLPPGDYIVEFAMPAGYTQVSPPNSAAADSDNNSDVYAATMRTPLISLPSSTSDLSWDMGVYNLAALGDRVWLDTNVDGVQDGGETGVSGVTVTLYSSAGITVTNTTTDATGIYTFTNLTPGNYYLAFSDLPADHAFTQRDQGGDNALDSDVNPISGITSLISLASGQTDLTWDAGIFPKIKLGDRVWIDLNANGIQDGDEEWIDANNNSVKDAGELNGVPGVKVTLYNGAGMVDYTYTDLDGNYLFEDLFPDTYHIVFSNIPTGYLRSPQDANSNVDDSIDSDADASFTITDFSISASDLTRDMGLYKPASLGDYVWHDQNANGVQDAGEPGIDGATVTLYSAGADHVFGGGDDVQVGAATTTDATGVYSFTNLTPGFYYVQFSLPTGFDAASPTGKGTTTTDSDADPMTLLTTVTELTSGENDPTWDAGFYQFASLGDFVWEDMNGNGVQDAGEPGINLVGVALDGTDGAGNVVHLTTNTDSAGAYSFPSLAPGSYHVTFTPPAGYSVTVRDSSITSATDSNDSDADPTTGATIDTTLVSGEDDPTWDAGLYRPATIGDRVWEDRNGDGIQDASELTPTFPGVTVTLQYAGPDGTFGNADDNLTAATTTTDASGNYLFDNRIPGTYKIVFDQPSGYAFTQRDVGDDATDSDVPAGTAATGTTIATALVSNEDDRTWDAGLYQLLSLGNRVWDDANNNGIIDDGASPGIDGVTVKLYRDSNGNGTIDTGAESTAVATMTTSNGGAYLFSDLTQGKYLVEIVAPAGYISSTGINGSASGPYEPASPSDTDSNDNGTTSGAVIRSAVRDLLPNATPLAEADTTMPTAVTNPARDENSDLTIDFGLFKPASLGDFVWFDRDANGVQDGGDETGISGVTVTLLDGAGNPVDGDPITAGVQTITTTTSALGAYQFTNLIPGTYRVGFDLPATYLRSPTGKGTADTDSNADLATGQTASFSLTAGQSDQTWDSGLYQLVRLGNQVWDDLNNNGVFDSPTESGIDGVTVNLTGTDGAGNAVSLSTVTAAGGFYLFDNLVPGTYTVTLPASNFSGAGKLAAIGNLPAYISSTGTNGSATGPYEGAALADPDTAVIDSDDSGTTDVGGNVASLPITLRSQDEPAAGVDTDDNNGNLTVDFGVFRPLSLGDLVWNDLNNNKAYDSGTESGINGVTVQLYRDLNGDGDVADAGETTAIASTTTAGGGIYRFDNLIPGDYVVVIPASNFTGTGKLTSFRSSDGGALTDSATDPDDDSNDDDNGVGPSAGVATGSVSSAAVTLSLGSEPTNDGDSDSNSNLSLDFGFYSLGLGNLVFEDKDNNGLFDGGDVGLDGRTVRLYYDADGSGSIDTLAENIAVATITTSNGGHYFFGGLRDGGSYQIGLDTGGAGWVSSTGGANGAATGPYEPGIAVTGDNTDIDNDDNGTQAAGNTVSSALFSVAVGTQPTGETDTALPTGVTNLATDNSTNLSVDFGLFNHARMGDWVWIDTNGNGVQDGSETNGVGGVTVTLYDTSDNVISTTTTLPTGIYGFSYLKPGSYYVTFDLTTVPANYAVSPPNAGGTAASNSDANQTTGTTATFTLAAGDNDTNWDMGIYPLLSLGNLIWDDQDDNGTFEAGEPVFNGVTVELYRDTNPNGVYDAGIDVLVTSQPTVGGNYLFSDLTQGDYLVVIPASNFASGQPLYRYRSSTGANGAASGPYEPAADPDNNINNDDNGSDVSAGGPTFTRAISLNPSFEPTTDGDGNNGNLTLDLGFFQHLTLGNQVWNDTNNDGLLNNGEVGIKDVTVDLYLDNGDGSYDAGTDTFVANTTTNGSGIYSFTDLIPGNYIAVIPASNFATGVLKASGGLSAYTSSTGTNGSLTGAYELAPDPDSDIDNDDNGSRLGSGDIATYAITLDSGTEPDSGVDGDGTNANETVDFGLFKPASIGNFVWEDNNGNGVQDAGEPGIDGVTVELYQGATLISSTTTLPSGYYQFTNLIPNDYAVHVTAPAGYVFTAQDQGGDTADSDANPSGVMISTTLIAGESDMTWDAGLYKPVSLGNQVWYDTNNSRSIDTGEVGISGVQVELFFDANGNGTIEDNSGSGGVNETLPVAVDTTDASGTYLFIERTDASGNPLATQHLLNPGTYVVGIPASQLDPITGVLRGMFSSGTTMLATGTADEVTPDDPDTGGATAPDGDDNGKLQIGVVFYSGGVLAPPVTLSPGGEPVGESPDVDEPNPAVRPDANDNQTVDFGFYTASLGNLVWIDDGNGGGILADGIRNGSESGSGIIGGVTVRLLAQDGSEIAVGPDGLLGTTDDALGGVTTNASGAYAFGRLPQGSYQVQIDLPAGYVSTRDTTNSLNPSANTDYDDNGVGSDQTATTATSNVFTLAPGAEVTVDNATGSSNDPTIDFGIVRHYSLGNRIWDDRDNSGVQDSGESGISGVTVRLLQSDGVTPALRIDGSNAPDQTSDASGFYRFDLLPAGDYIVEVIASNFSGTNALAGYSSSTSPAPDPDTVATDEDDNGTLDVGGGVRSAPVTLGEGSGTAEPTSESGGGPESTAEAPDGQANRTVDFGFYPSFSLGNRVWNDIDNSGTINAADGATPGIAGVTVRLLKSDGINPATDATGATVADQTTTAYGSYLFTNLFAGDYIVEVVPPAGYRSSTGDANAYEPAPNTVATDDDDNGSAIGAAVRSAIVTLSLDSEPTGEPTTPGISDSARDNNANYTVDFGLYKPLSLGNLVWEDLDNNGVVNGTEAGISGVNVRLYRDSNDNGIPDGTAIATATTNATGHYLFTNLGADTYIVEVDTPAGMVSSTGQNLPAPYEPAPDPDTGGALAPDSDDNGTASGAVVRSAPVTLSLGAEPTGEPATPGLTETAADANANYTVDFGFYTALSLGNRVWNDANNNGTIDDGASPGIDGVDVRLYRDNDGNGTPDDVDGTPGVTSADAIQTVTTTGGGYYLFTNLSAGGYIVEIAPAASYRSSTGTTLPWPYETAPDPNTTEVDSDDNGTTSGAVIRSGSVTLSVGGEPTGETDTLGGDPTADNNSNLTVDFGLYEPVSLGNLVFIDRDNNGTFDGSDSPLEGATVDLFLADGTTPARASDGSLVASITTLADGRYQFSNLPAGDYVVRVTPPAGYRSSDDIGTSADPENSLNNDDNGIGNSTTGAVFSGVISLTSGGEPTDDGDTDNNTNLTLDFGFYQPVSLGDLVFIDRDNNGLYDGSNSPLQDAVVALFFADGTTPATDITGAAVADQTTGTDGLYLFGNLKPGDYVVSVTPPAGYSSSDDIPGSATPNNNTNSDDNGVGDSVTTPVSSGVISLTSGEEPTNDGDTNNNTNLTVDFGFYQPLSLGDLVFIDRDNNGRYDGSDDPLAGATVDLYFDADGNGALEDNSGSGGVDETVATATQTTGADGLYLFGNLKPGSYVVRVTPPAGYRSSDDIGTSADPNNNTNSDDNGVGDSVTTPVSSALITLSSGDEPDGAPDRNTNLSLDFGFYQPLSLGDLVFIDRNNNGSFDSATDSPLPSATVELLESDGITQATDVNGNSVASQITLTNGLYLFTSLKPGSYVVRVTPPAGYSSSDDIDSSTNPNNNTNDDDNGVGVGATTSSNLITLSSGEEPDGAPALNSNLTLDFGFHQPASLGDFVWHDQNANGVQDAGEPGIDGATATLYSAGADHVFGGGDDVQVGAATTTDATGVYTFTNLTPGFYYVQFSLPVNFEKASPTGKGTTTTDSDANPTTLRTTVTELISGESDPSWDAGFYSLVRLGNQVWDDVNNNGVFDSLTESGIKDVTVTLTGTDGAGNAVSLNIPTDGNGFYLFDNLVPGEYVVSLPASNFTTGGALAATATLPAYISSTGTNGSLTGTYEGAALADPDTTVLDGDDSGTTDGSSNVASLPVTLTSQGEPDTGVDTDDTNGNLTLDFGVFRPLSLGNLVWQDLNNNGAFDSATESGIGGVTVELRRASDNGLVATTTTDTSGVYGFTNLIPDDYVVVIPASNFTGPLSGFFSSSGTNGNLAGAYEPAPDPDGNQDNHDDGSLTGGNVVSLPVTLAVDSEPDSGADGDHKNGNQTVDFGFFKPARLGNFVWDDLNGNGVQDDGATGVDNVTVTLYDNSTNDLVASITTSGGLYSFDNLIPGDYTIIFSNLPTGYTFSPTGQGTSATDSDASPTDGSTAIITLSAGQNDLDWDAGIYHTLSLGNLVWDDLNNDGVFDSATESGINDVTVELRRASDNSLVDSTTTAGGGFYQFSGLAQGDYIVVLPSSSFTGALSGYRSSTGAHSLTAGPSEAAPGPNNDNDNDDNGSLSLISGDIQSAPVHLSALGEPDVASDGDDKNGNQTVDFGLFKPASIGDRVWEDTDGNGVQDAGEPGVSGVSVTLYDAGADGQPGGGDDQQVGSTTTDGSRIYEFSDLPPASYYLVFDKPAGYHFTRRNAGTDDAIDSDADRTSGETIATVLISGQSDSSWDAGINQLASLGDTVWQDLNANGVQDAGEPGVPGVTVTLYNTASGLQVGTPQTTDADGFYQFISLPPDRYHLIFSDLPTGYLFTPQGQGGDSSKDSDADPNSGQTADINLTSSQDDPTWDAGIYTTASLGDRVWNDLNANGVQDAGEVGVNSVTVTLYRADGTSVDSTTTTTVGAEDGVYGFSGLTPGDYYLVFSKLPAGYIFSPADRGGDDGLDSDADRASGQSAAFAIASGANDLRWDAGIYLPASLGDLIWDDANANGMQDSGEVGVDGVTVKLIQGGTVISTTTTASDGSYHFRELGAGDYQIEIVPPAGRQISPLNQGGNDGTDSDIDRASGQSDVASLTPGAVNNSLDGGLYQLASVGNRVWEDSNRDGIFGADEVGLSGVTVELYRSDGTLLISAVTDATGAFIFTDLEPGDYYIRFYAPAGWEISPQDQGGNNSIDSDADPTSGITKAFSLGVGTLDLTWWAGMSRPPTSITLQSFTLDHKSNGNLLRWETGTELNSAGFAIYRSATGLRADAELVSEPLILARGVGGGGARYSWLDRSADLKVGYSYWLVEVEIGGARHEYRLEQPGLQQSHQVYLPIIVR